MQQATRFQLVDVPQALPGECLLCGGHDRDFFVDTGRNLEFHGAIYFCSDCLNEIGIQAGYAPPSLRKELEHKIESLEKTVYELTVANEGLEEAVHGLRRARNLSIPVTVDSPGVFSSTPVAESAASTGAPGVGSGESESPEPLHGEGPASVPDSSDSADFSLNF